MTKDTFFSPSFGRRPGTFVGREQIIAEFEEGLTNTAGTRDRAVLIMGQRGSGKTVLLLELAESARRNNFVVSPPVITDDGMLDRIIENIQVEGSRYFKTKKQLSGGSIGVLGISASLTFSPEEREERSFSYKLKRLAEMLEKKGKGILILVDEVQANHRELRSLVIAYQEMVGAGCNVAIAMAGLPGAVSSVLNEKVLTFLHRAKKITLPDLKTGEIDAFFARAFTGMGISISDENRLKAAKAAMGSPYHMQLIGYYITRYAEAGKSVTPAQMKNALQKAEAEYMDGVCIAVAESMTDLERRFVAAMGSNTCRIRDVAEKLGIRPDSANNHRRRLLDAGIIESPRRGEVRCAVPYLAEYLVKAQSE